MKKRRVVIIEGEEELDEYSVEKINDESLDNESEEEGYDIVEIHTNLGIFYIE